MSNTLQGQCHNLFTYPSFSGPLIDLLKYFSKMISTLPRFLYCRLRLENFDFQVSLTFVMLYLIIHLKVTRGHDINLSGSTVS